MTRASMMVRVLGRVGSMVGLLLPAGCSRPGVVWLEQPQVASADRRLELRSEQVYWSQADGVCRLLAELPLPGARTGRPTYVLYLRAAFEQPDRRGAVFARQPRGFLIQTRGARRGLTPVTGGFMRASAAPESSPERWRVQAELSFEDGTRLTADFSAIRNDWRLTRFETRENAADVRAIMAVPPADPDQGARPPG